MKSLVSSVYVSLYCSDIGLPLSVCFAVRVRNSESECYTFSADITLCHILHLQFYIHINYYFDLMRLPKSQQIELYHNTFKNARGFLKKQKKIQKIFIFFSRNKHSESFYLSSEAFSLSFSGISSAFSAFAFSFS